MTGVSQREVIAVLPVVMPVVIPLAAADQLRQHSIDGGGLAMRWTCMGNTGLRPIGHGDVTEHPFFSAGVTASALHVIVDERRNSTRAGDPA